MRVQPESATLQRKWGQTVTVTYVELRVIQTWQQGVIESYSMLLNTGRFIQILDTSEVGKLIKQSPVSQTTV